MRWYEGGIVDAVTLSRTNNSIFVVYIHGSGEKSQKMMEVINDEEVSRVLEGNNFTSIRIEANSRVHSQFCEIYKPTAIPSMYFIGKSGSPLKILTDTLEAPGLLKLMNDVVIENGGTPTATASVSEEIIRYETLSSSEALPEANVQKTEETEQPAEAEPPAERREEVTASVNIDDKMKLAQSIIEKKRAQKEAEEKEKEKAKELERRQLGQDVQKMKRWMQDQEIKAMMEERQKERQEEKDARDRVRRQIEEDKREKAARMASQSGQIVPPIEQPRGSASLSNSTTARLQFRLPDGSINTKDFPKTCALQDVVDYIKANLTLSFPNFVLSTTFPRREFSNSDFTQTLAELELVPTAVILILPITSGAVTTHSSTGLMGMFWLMLAPFLSLLGYIKSFVHTPAVNRVNNRASSDPVDDTRRDKRSANPEQDIGESSSSSSRPLPKRRAGEAAIRRQGNIHRLTDRDSDDDNNTWNGNSTQQM